MDSIKDPLLHSLLEICKHHYISTHSHSLTSGLALNKGKLSAESIPKAAEKAGLKGAIRNQSLSEVNTLALPALLLLNDGSSCVLKQIDSKTATIHTISGTANISLPTLSEQYSGTVIYFKPNQNQEGLSATTKPTQHHWLLSPLKQAIPIYSEVLLASLFINLFALGTPLFVMNVYDRVLANHAFETLWVLAIGMGLLIAFDLTLKLLRSWFLDQAGHRIDLQLSSTVFSSLLNQRQQSLKIGSSASYLHEFEGFRQFLTSTTITTLIDLPFIFLFLALIGWIAGPLVWIPVTVIPVAILVSFLLQYSLKKHVDLMMQEGSRKQIMVYETLACMSEIKIHNAQSVLQRKWEQLAEQCGHHGLKVRKITQTALSVTQSIQQIAYVFLIVGGVYLVTAGELTMGGLIACSILSGRALAPATQITGLLMRLHQSRSALNGIKQIVNAPKESDIKNTIAPAFIKGDIALQQVSFSWPEQPPVLDNISLSIRQGEKIGILGPMGCGKSTLLSLIAGLTCPTHGRMLIDGIASEQLHPAQWREQLGFYTQDSRLLYGNIKDNITIGQPETTDEELLKVARLTGVTRFCAQHPEGFSRSVGEGGFDLSGGQRQAVALARALLKNPPILLLDEPTSAMDLSEENRFMRELTTLIQDKTLILVTHRPGLLKLVDRLIVLDQGKLVADGPKNDVIKQLNQRTRSTTTNNAEEIA
ncbi:type I secretion system permease/ATPase [Endozoicomonas montiporae]|uniref:ATP-binding cassette, subfamily C, bacterial LapB n=1 Tax=Endozoicomonas montiporae CL-33 TaxID=570277 RepID=A0A142B9T6_9GAMM|nr:type I secretion system permease/ATPase [Endozoicomonas montiporae]AMO55512.1 ATP-binding cassette, subfamily C, bacterial LapB [Endozoicomonas montiporae CL-33]